MTDTKNEIEEILKKYRRGIQFLCGEGETPKPENVLTHNQTIEELASKLQEVERASFDKAADIVAQTLPEYTERSILLMTEPDRILAKEHNNKRKGLLAQLKGKS